ncbi:MAG: AraC family transcriptional regulator ligand-binding domain-containing protein [Oleiphilaceae bacterium]|nr:AraC family transcriptional regulator ligand-binding domain-containing protein [Oleiphilaceae bacterium]
MSHPLSTQQNSILSLIPLLEVFSQYGHDPNALMAKFDFDLTHYSGNALIDRSLEFAMIEEALALESDPLFGFKVGTQATFSSYGTYALTVMTAPTFRQACECAVALQQLSLLYMPMSLHYHEDALEMRFSVPPGNQRLQQFIIDRDFAGVYGFMKELVADPGLIPMACGVARPRPTGELLQRYQQHCHASLNYDQSVSWFRFPLQLMGASLKHGNPLAHQLYRVQAQDLMQRFYLHDGNLVTRCKQLLLGHEYQWPDAAQVAQQLGTSERSLRRHLQQHHSSFRQLLDEVRKEKAMEALTVSGEPIAHIAERLGYTESASFLRAFKRWTGLTPGAYQKQLEGGRS